MEPTANSKRSAVMLITSLLIVGTIGALRRYIPLSSAALALFRGAIGAVVLAVVVLVRRRKRRCVIPLKMLGMLALNGAFLGINWMLLFEAYNHTTVAKATLCYYLQPTLVLLLSPWLFHETLTKTNLLCAAGSLGGMVLVSGVIGADGAPQDGKGILLGLGAACFYAAVVILNKRLGNVDIYEKTLVQLASAALVVVPYTAATGGFDGVAWDARLIGLLLLVGVVYTGVVYVLYFGSMTGLRAQTISMLSYIDPITALIVSVALLGEPLTVGAAVGAVLILGCAYISERPSRRTVSTKTERVE